MTPKQLSRVRLVQAIYRWQLGGEDYIEIEKEYLSKTKKEDNFSKLYFSSIFIPLIENQKKLEKKIKPFLDRKISELGFIEKSILLLATFELLYKKEIPPRVVINEAIEISKEYGADNSYKFINNILDNFIK
ncbi:Transcription termination protein NusB [hydrothermal vent metagenome]|uniref:Transcription termination protein NusB n=1 Tax=hydrothermal vent metagenome TaxID=652676 RepID=A0A1W1BW04_9ZZZZ